MSLNNLKDTSEGGEFELPPQGLHLARCAIICDLGMVTTQWGSQHKIYWAFELVNTKMTTDDRPFSIGEQLTTKLGKNNSGEPSRLRGRLESWRGRPYDDDEIRTKGVDLNAVLGAPCQIQIMHEPDKKDRTKMWPRINAILPGKDLDVPQLSKDPIYFDWDAPDADAQYHALPDFLQKKMGDAPHKTAEEATALADEQMAAQATDLDAPPPPFDDDIPF